MQSLIKDRIRIYRQQPRRRVNRTVLIILLNIENASIQHVVSPIDSIVVPISYIIISTAISLSRPDEVILSTQFLLVRPDVRVPYCLDVYMGCFVGVVRAGRHARSGRQRLRRLREVVSTRCRIWGEVWSSRWDVLSP